MSVNVSFLSPPSSVPEGAGSYYYFTMSATAGETPTSWTINWGDGTTPTNLGAYTGVNALHVFGDNNAGRTISATCYFNSYGGGSGNAYATHSLSVTNVAPTWSLTGPSTYYATTEYTLSSSDLYDPGQDTVTQWTVDWGDGSSPTTYGGSTSTYTHTFAATGTYTLTTTAQDEDGSYSQTTTAVAVPGIALKATPHEITITGAGGWAGVVDLKDDNGGSLATCTPSIVAAVVQNTTTAAPFFSITSSSGTAGGGMKVNLASAPAGPGGPTIGADYDVTITVSGGPPGAPVSNEHFIIHIR